jgi:hypothetical protein
MRRMTVAATLTLGLVQPSLGCTVPLPPMNAADLSAAEIAFVGTVIAIEMREEATLPPWPRMTSCTYLVEELGLEIEACKPPYLTEAAVFKIEEPMRGVDGGEYAVPQSGGTDCGTVYEVGTRYVFGSLGVNGQVWIVAPGITAAEWIADWRRFHERD